MNKSSTWNSRLLILNRLIIDLMREAHVSLHDDNDFGSNAERALVVSAIAVGQLEGRPMSATKMSHYIGIPRPTLLRRLDELASIGLVNRTNEKKFVFPMLGHAPPRWIRTVDAMERHIHSASTELSRLDSVTIARRK